MAGMQTNQSGIGIQKPVTPAPGYTKGPNKGPALNLDYKGPSHITNSTHIIGSRPTGEQPGSGYTWGSGTKQPAGPGKPVGKSPSPAGPGKPVGIGNYSGAKTMDTPIDKASHPDRAPSLPFNNKIPGA